MEANPITSAIPADPGLKQDATTKGLREGEYHTEQGAKEAVDPLPIERQKELEDTWKLLHGENGIPPFELSKACFGR